MTETVAPSSILEAISSGRAPRAARLAAARGALPLAPEELLQLQVRLREDADAEIVRAAEESLSALPANDAIRMLDAAALSSEAQLYLARESARWPVAGRKLAARQGLDADCLLALGACSDPETLSILSQNQVALESTASLGQLLLGNSFLPDGARGRLLDNLDELDKKARQALQRIAASQAAAEAQQRSESTIAPARDPFLAALGIDAEVEALLPQLEVDLAELSQMSELVGEPENDEEAALFSRLARMNVGQKLRLALFGTATERSILVRDSNRLVAAAVVKNPKFTEQEADSVSRSRNVNEIVLRLIARNKEFSSSYQIQHNLVKNPRCPIEISMHYINGLNDRDLNMLVKNRNISDAIRRHAKKIHDAREERRRVRVGAKKH